jgi:hypothetical protein
MSATGSGRPEKKIDPSTGPLAQFALDMKAARWRAGTPTYTEMSRRTGKSIGTLSEAALGESCPSWATLCSYLSACSVDPEDWRPRWEMLASEQQRLQAGLPVRYQQRKSMVRMMPENVTTLEEFILALRHLRAWHGNPPYKMIARRSGTPYTRGIAISTISTLLNPQREKWPSWSVVSAYLSSFEISSTEQMAWRRAWTDLAMARENEVFQVQERHLDLAA